MANSGPTQDFELYLPRRKFLTLAAIGVGAGVGGAVWASNFANAMTTPGRFAEELLKTPQMTEGPFYPDKLPLDTDNDLLVINDAITPAVGKITHLSGRVLTTAGSPISNAFVEIWQVDNTGAYLHKDSNGAKDRDTNFQGYGRFLTNRKGEYYFRTIKPVPYPGRVPHIHFAVSINGHRVLTTQMLTRGHDKNEQDGLFRRIRDEKSRLAITAEYKPVAESKFGELSAEFDLVLGVTPDENAQFPIQGGVSKPSRR
ncbi:dioxygenase family protein [Mariniblastus fucicola]|uniref:Protocatechuate 3,4-dioxygenase beta chain n=1 Tax=Mariniblastus fucicola TaxID=980251 RepID=A0A5B9PRR1_9BACT|nr:protocatechuate 3,4-dioxygenase [Mariniblastus fucicola]QEG25201.1 Protocatechuate 3,4-dioxygenase beta chain [Mariniblastus fucicola]